MFISRMKFSSGTLTLLDNLHKVNRNSIFASHKMFRIDISSILFVLTYSFNFSSENLFEDGNHLYRFLDNDPVVSECQNISRGITVAKPKPIVEIASRLRFLSYAIFEAYTSEDGRHVDYRSIHGSEEFARSG